MPKCRDCVHWEVCSPIVSASEDSCAFYKDSSRFVELNIAKKIKHTPDIYKMKEFHKLGLGSGMDERSIFWTCSNCELWVSLAHKFCPNCGAKFED